MNKVNPFLFIVVFSYGFDNTNALTPKRDSTARNENGASGVQPKAEHDANKAKCVIVLGVCCMNAPQEKPT